jgi:protein translocase, SecG subunit
MQQVLLAIHLMIVLALTGVILLQRSEGGLGLGGGGGLSGLMSSRGQANLLTRATAVLATLFFITSMALAVVSKTGQQSDSIFSDVPVTINSGASEQGQPGDSSDNAPAAESEQPSVPQAQ